ncbi:MAG: hypothetical protein ABUK15_07290 [Anaerolineales bacterium]
MKIIRGVGGFLANPFVLSMVLFFVLLGLSQLWSIIPRGDLNNKLAAFEVDKVAELLIDVAWAAFCLFAIRTDSFKWVAAKLVIALLLVLQIWDVISRVTCKMASNEIVAETGQWGVESAKGLCARTVGPGPQIVEILFGLSIMGWILCLYLRTRKTSKG